MSAEALPQQLRELVSALPGVVAVYPARPALRSLVDTAVAGVVGAVGASTSPADEPVVVTEKDGMLHVEVTLGLADSVPAADTVRKAYDAVAAHLAASGLAVAGIRILVANVDPA